MLQVRGEICTRCGLCVQNCPPRAISIIGGKAFIDQDKCIECLRCQKVCPRGAIKEKVPSIWKLGETYRELEEELEKILERLEKLQVARSRQN